MEKIKHLSPEDYNMVVMPVNRLEHNTYPLSRLSEEELIEELLQSIEKSKAGYTRPARQVSRELREKYAVWWIAGLWKCDSLIGFESTFESTKPTPLREPPFYKAFWESKGFKSLGITWQIWTPIGSECHVIPLFKPFLTEHVSHLKIQTSKKRN